ALSSILFDGRRRHASPLQSWFRTTSSDPHSLSSPMQPRHWLDPARVEHNFPLCSLVRSAFDRNPHGFLWHSDVGPSRGNPVRFETIDPLGVDAFRGCDLLSLLSWPSIHRGGFRLDTGRAF